MADRIKQIKQKTDNGYNTIPLGADSQYVTMVSGLNLEQELYIGCPHKVIISTYIKSDNSTGDRIQEWYFAKGTNIISFSNEDLNSIRPNDNDDTNDCIYYKKTEIPDIVNAQNPIVSTVLCTTAIGTATVPTTILFNNDNDYITEIQGGNL